MLNKREKIEFENLERVNRLVEGTKVIGDLISESHIRIDGEVEGNVTTSAKVVIGENGYIKGNLTCLEAEIEGRLDGVLSIEGILILRETARVTGDIYTPKLHVEEGALFLGACNMKTSYSQNRNSSYESMASAEDANY